jgi:hypothetical protein
MICVIYFSEIYMEISNMESCCFDFSAIYSFLRVHPPHTNGQLCVPIVGLEIWTACGCLRYAYPAQIAVDAAQFYLSVSSPSTTQTVSSKFEPWEHESGCSYGAAAPATATAGGGADSFQAEARE